MKTIEKIVFRLAASAWVGIRPTAVSVWRRWWPEWLHIT